MKARQVPIATLVVAALLGAACAQKPEPPPEETAAARTTQTGETQPSAESPHDPLPSTVVTLYFPSTSGEGLVAETREIFLTASPVDRAKQILSDLLTGPTGSGSAAAVPAGTGLRQVFVLGNGTAYVDLSPELTTGIEGGSMVELLTVYSIVNSLALNVPEITRVGILVGGSPCETLNGHLDLRRPLAPDRNLLQVEEPSGDETAPDEPASEGGIVASSHAGRADAG